MKPIIQKNDIDALKRNLVLRFSLLLSIFIILLVASYVIAAKINTAKQYDRFLVNATALQRSVVRQYVSEVNQALIGIAAPDLKLALLSKKKADHTARLFENVHDALINGGEVVGNAHYVDRGDKFVSGIGTA